MKNGPHNSMIPNQNFSNIQSGFKTNMKSRHTMAPFSTMNPSTTFTNKTWDINKSSVEENAEKLFHFLATNDFPIGSSKKILQTPRTKNEYLDIFTFILKKIRPDISPNFIANEETVNQILSELKFPMKYEKKHFSSISQAYTWPKFLNSLTYMCELADYCDFINNNESYNDDYLFNMFCKSTEEKSEEEKEDYLFNSFLISTFKNKNVEEEREKIFSEMLLKTQDNISNLEKNINEYQIIDEKITKLKNELPDIKSLENSKSELEKSLVKDKEKLVSIENKILSLKKEIENKSKNNLEKEKEIENLNKKLKNTENLLKNQKLQIEDVAKLNERKTILDANYENLNMKKKEMIEKVNELKSKINEQKTNLIKSQINTKEKYGIDNIDLDNLILNCENPNYNINEMKNYFNNEINNAKSLINIKKSELNEKQIELSKIENNLRLIEENILNKKLELSSLSNDYKNKEEEIENEKIKGNNFLEQYQNEYNNVNQLLSELMAKCSNLELEIMNLENLKKEKIIQYEKLLEEADKLNKEYGKKTDETSLYVENMKDEILSEIRQNYKSYNEIFIKMKEENNKK